MSAGRQLRVVIADDDAFARCVTKHTLQAAGMAVVAEAADGREAVELSLHWRPDVVVMDVVMPRLDGILATRRILEADPGQRVVVLMPTRMSSDLRRCEPAPSMPCPGTQTPTC